MSRATPDPEKHGLLTGDIQIEPEDDYYTAHKPLSDQGTAIFHAVVIDTSAADGVAYMHSTTGKSSGVKQFKYSHKERAVPFLLLRCKDPEVRAELGKVVEVFALTPDEKKKTPKKSYLTPYADPQVRAAKRTELDEKYPLACAYMRAMRTYQKSQLGGKQSLSKHQGLSCSQFVMYSLQGAVYGQMHNVIWDKLDDEAKGLLTKAQAVVDERIASGEGAKLKDVMASSEEQMAQLNEQLQALLASDDLVMANLAYFSLNPKGISIDELVETLVGFDSALVEEMVSVPVIQAEGEITTYVLTKEQACELCPDGEGIFSGEDEIPPLEQVRVDAFLARQTRLKEGEEIKVDASETGAVKMRTGGVGSG